MAKSKKKSRETAKTEKTKKDEPKKSRWDDFLKKHSPQKNEKKSSKGV